MSSNNRVNEGASDRMIRVLLAVILAVIGLFVHGVWSAVLYILSILSLLTGLSGVCLLYRLFGINTTHRRT